jgi:uncharacterized protein YndB with AHSA1/START domain
MSEAATVRKSSHEPTVFTQPSDTENQVSRIFHAPAERVFRLFTDPATIPYVFAPDPKSVTIEKLDFRKGGHYSILVRTNDGSTLRFYGEYREIDPPRRVVNTFQVDAFPGSLAVETDDFEPMGDFTRLTVRWKYTRAEDRDKMWSAEGHAVITAMWDTVEILLTEGHAAPPPTAAGRRA